MEDVVIVSAARTPVGSFNGAFASVAAHDLGTTALRAAMERAGLEPGEVDEVILGQVLAAAQGQNPARQAARNAGLPDEKTAFGINQLCGSGLRAVALAAQQIRTGESRVVAAGGMESMSQATHAAYLRGGTKMGALEFTDENVAQKYQITRDAQDQFAVASQNKASAASKSGRFKDEIAPVTVKGRKGDVVVDTDEYIRHETDLAAMQRLKPAFNKEGTVTAGNASGINDGAAVLLLMGADPIPSSRLALKRAGWSVHDLDLIEANEAFAAQACAVNKDLGWDADRVNVNGGAIALGHPIGASGARVLVTLLHEMQKRDAKRGLATLCVGGGMGVAMCVER